LSADLPPGAKELLNEKLCKAATPSRSASRTSSSTSTSDETTEDVQDSGTASTKNTYTSSSDDESAGAGAHAMTDEISPRSKSDGMQRDEMSPRSKSDGMPREGSQTSDDEDASNESYEAADKSTDEMTVRAAPPPKPLHDGQTQGKSAGSRDTTSSTSSYDDKVVKPETSETRSQKSYLSLAQTGQNSAKNRDTPLTQDADEGFTESFLSNWDSSEMPSLSASLDESGYKQIAALKNDDEMKVFIRRVARSCNMKVIDEGGLNGVVSWFSGVEDTSSFEELKVALFTALLAKSQDHWAAVKNMTGVSANSATLDLVGYSQVRSMRSPKAMVEFVRRMIESMGIRITNDGGFDGMMHFYSEPDDMESFQRLMSEIKKATFEHSWAEME